MMSTVVNGSCGVPQVNNEGNGSDYKSHRNITSSKRCGLRTYSVKIPPGLRALLNDITKEVLCVGEEIQKEPDIYRFCAEFMERLLAQRDPKLRPKMIPTNTRSAQDQNDSFPSYNREGTFHLTNTDSDSGMDEIYTTDAGATTDAEDTLSVESALQKLADAALSDTEDSLAAPDVVKGFNLLSGKVGQPNPELHDRKKILPLLKTGTSGLGKVSKDFHGSILPITQIGCEGNENPLEQNDEQLHCLELEFTLDNHKVSKNKGSTSNLLATDNHDQTLLARVDLLVSRKNVHILPREDRSGKILNTPKVETKVESHSKIPIELIQQAPEVQTAVELPTPAHSINSTTSDLPPSPTSLKSWTSGHRGGEYHSEALYPSEPKDICGTSELEHSPEENGPRTGTIRVWLPSESLAVAGLPSSGTKEGSLAKRECEDLLGASQSGHQFIVAKDEEGEAQATSPHANSLDHQGHTGIATIPGAVKQTSSLEVAVQTELTYPQGEPGGPEGSLLSSRPQAEEVSLEKESVVLSQLSNESQVPPPRFPSFENVTTQTQSTTLTQVSTQTQIETEQDLHLSDKGNLASRNAQSPADCVQDCLTARVLLEHLGTVFSSVDSQEAVNYLDLSRLGEEGETPGSDEIWLAVDSDEEKGFLTSTEEDPDSLSVETDKLSAIATMAGRFSTDSIAADTPSEIDSMGMGNNNNLDEMKKDSSGFGEFGEMYANLRERLQSILNQELDPIQDTLDNTGKNLHNLTEKLLQMEKLLTTLCDNMQKVSSELQASQSNNGTISHSTRPLDDMRNASEKSLDQIVSKIETLSAELGQADTANQLREDNHQLRRDLNLFRNREKHLIERIESMEKLLHKSSAEMANGIGSRSASRRGSQTSDSEFPPIEKVQAKKPMKKEHEDSTDPITKQSLMQAGQKPGKKLLARRGSHERTKPYAATHAIDIDAIHAEIQVARSDNVILRQDLQVCRDREYQLVHRNKELEDKLLAQAKVANTNITQSCSKTDVASAPIITNKILPRAEIDINIDFTPPGRAIIKERPPTGPNLNQATMETISPIEQETLGEKPLKKVQGLKASEVHSKKMKDDRKKVEPCSNKKSPNVPTQRASFEVQDWKVNIKSVHDLEVSKDSQKAIIVSPKIEEKLKEALIQQEPELSDEAQPIVPLKLNEMKAEIKSEPKLKSPPKSFIPTTATSKKEEPVKKPATLIQEVKKERVRPAKVVRKPPPPPQQQQQQQQQQHPPIEIHDPRADPIPKPAQFPCARPPRDYVPGRNYQKRTSVADILSHDSANHSYATLSKSNNHSSRELIQSGPELVQMFIKEEPAEMCDSAVPVCQARESPDGANSSVMNGGSTSKCSGRISVNLMDQADEKEDLPESYAPDIILEYVLQEESELREFENQKRRDAFWGNKRRPAIIRRPKKRSRSLSQEKSKARRLKQKHASVERLPTLSAFDEERIVWMKNYENESTREDERRRRALVRRAAAQTLQSAMNEIAMSSNSTISTSIESISETKSKVHKSKVSLANNPYEEPRPGTKDVESATNNSESMIPKKKTSRKQWDTDKIIGDSECSKMEQHTSALLANTNQVTENEKLKKYQTDLNVPSNHLLSAECFIVSRGWQMDQSKLLRALDRIKCANFSRVQIATTINRVVENVRPNLDIVVIHIGNQELLEASLSIGKSQESVHNVAGSVATVLSRQILKVAGQNKSTQFLISCPLSKGSETKNITKEETQTYSGLRKIFNATLKANCSSFSNIQCSENDNLTEMDPDEGQSRESRYFSDSLQLNSAGMRKLAKNWESYLRRITRANDGELVLRLSSSDSGSNSSAGTTRNMAEREDQTKVPWKPY